jgi:hypothetical protein
MNNLKGNMNEMEGEELELTSPNAAEKCDIDEGIPSDDDLWGIIE